LTRKQKFYFLSQFSTNSSQRSGAVFPEVLGLDLHVTLAPEADLLQDPVLAGRGHTEVGVYFSLQNTKRVRKSILPFYTHRSTDVQCGYKRTNWLQL
jgi:hypothetical protein